jgi:hypothetical protein
MSEVKPNDDCGMECVFVGRRLSATSEGDPEGSGYSRTDIRRPAAHSEIPVHPRALVCVTVWRRHVISGRYSARLFVMSHTSKEVSRPEVFVWA